VKNGRNWINEAGFKPFFDVLPDALIRFSEKHMYQSLNEEKLGKFLEKSSFIEFSTSK